MNKDLQELIDWANEQPLDEDGADVIESDPVVTFLNRWHWRGERAVVEKELRDLIGRARHEA